MLVAAAGTSKKFRLNGSLARAARFAVFSVITRLLPFPRTRERRKTFGNLKISSASSEADVEFKRHSVHNLNYLFAIDWIF